MIPKIVKIFKVLFVNAKANNAPMNESGMEKYYKWVCKTVKSPTITRYTKTIAANKGRFTQILHSGFYLPNILHLQVFSSLSSFSFHCVTIVPVGTQHFDLAPLQMLFCLL
jgi:hypothetical protein